MNVIWRNRRGRTGRATPWSGLPKLWLEFGFEPRDLFVGVFWDRPDGIGWKHYVDIYVCVIPTLVLKVSPRWGGFAAWWRDIRIWRAEREW